MAIVRVYFDQDMRMGVDGFTELLRKDAGSGFKTADEKSMYIFLNRKRTYFKLLVRQQYVVAFRAGRKLHLDDIRRFPSFFAEKRIMPREIEAQITSEIGVVTHNFLRRKSA